MYRLFASRKYNELLDRCSIILSKNPRHLNALKYKAYSLYFLERYEEAVSCYDKAIEIESDDPSLYSGKSKSLEKLGRIEEAIYCQNLAKKSINKAPNLGHNSSEWGKSF